MDMELREEKIIEDSYEDELLMTLELEDGTQMECIVLAIFPLDEQQYIALTPVDQAEDEDGDIFLYAYSEDDNGQPILGDIEDDDLFDAVCDRFREKCDERPSVRKENPDVQFHIHIMGDRATLFLDSSGEPLYRRGYRVASHPAQISEVIAAAMVKLSGWQHDCDIIDPMCGSGTILIEAALAALNVPAGFFRHSFGFYRWKTFDQKRWEQIQDEADIRDDVPVNFYGSDISSRFIGMAKDNIREARLTDFIRVRRSPMNESRPVRTPSFVIFNPPYGERLDMEDIETAYKEIGDTLKQHYTGCTAFIISSNIGALKNIGLHASKRITLYNGALECKFMRFDLYKGTKNSDFRNLQNENSDN